MRRFLADNRGFSLIWLCAVLAVAGIALAAILPGGRIGSDGAKQAVTTQHMQKIEEATKAFMAYNLRRPCPSDATVALNTSTFGTEAGVAGVCATANFTAGSSVPRTVAGGVPTKALGLTDDYALDGYGRRIMYVVDRNATAPVTCHDMESHNIPGALPIYSTSTNTTALDYTMWALVSYGKSGHGAFSQQGSTMANRIDTGNSSADAAINAFAATGSMGTSTFTGKLVLKEPVSGINGFDSTVWYLNTTQNICAMGKAANNGFHIAGGTGVGSASVLATGDINGDGYTDLIIGMPGYNSSAGAVYVLFGGPFGWPVGGLPTATPFNLTNITGLGATVSSITAANPGVVSSSVSPGSGSTIHINGVTGMAQANGCFKAGGAGSSYNLADMNGNNINTSTWGTQSGGNINAGCGAIITNDISGLTGFGYTLAVGDINGDGADDIIVGSASTTTGVGYVVILGNKSFASMNASSLSLSSTPDKGFQIKTGSAVVQSSAAAIGDVNGDGTKDIILYSYANPPGSTKTYVIYGQPGNAWTSCSCYSSPTLDVTATAFNPTYGFPIVDSTAGTYPFGAASTLAAGDLNNDGYDDIVLGMPTYNASSGAVAVLFGRATADWNTAISNSTATGCSSSYKCVDISNASGGQLNGTSTYPKNAVLFTTATTSDHLGEVVLAADLNNDGVKDLIVASYSHVYGYWGNTGTWSNTVLSSSSNFALDTATNQPSSVVGSNFPSAMAVANVNGDGMPDLLLDANAAYLSSAQGYSPARTGAVFVIFQPPTMFSGSTAMFGSSLGTNGASQWFNSTTANTNSGNGTYAFRIDGANTGGSGNSLAVLDLNRDGKNDIAITTWLFGDVYVLYGRRTIPWDAAFDMTTLY